MTATVRMHTITAALVAVVLAVVSTVAVAAEGTGATDDHPLLARAQENVQQVTARLESARGDREAAALALAEVEGRLAEVEAAVNEAAAAVRRQEVEVAAAGDRLEELRAEVARLEEQLEQRSVSRYMRGTSIGLSPVLGADGVRDAADRSQYLDLVTAADDASLEDAEAARVALRGAAARFDAESERLAAMEVEQRALLAQVEELLDARAAVLADAEAEVDDLELLQDDVDDDYDRVAALIAAGTETSVAAAPPSSAGYGWPICSRINSRFGYRWGRQHKGIDLDGDTGAPIAAAKAGRVVSAEYSGGYGNLTLIDHGDGVVTAYAHQSQIGVSAGQRVERGELIGLLGNTGNSTGPHLHFETRVNGVAVDPLQYLPSGC